MVKGSKRKLRITSRIIPFLFVVVVVTIIFLIKPNHKTVSPTLLKLDEGYGTAIKDSANTLSGTITSGTWASEEMCLSGRCLYFNGNNTTVNFGDNNSYDFTGTTSFTIELWFRHAPMTSGTQVLVAKANSSAGYKIQMESDGDLTFAIDDDAVSFPDDTISSTAATYDDNKWHHLAAVKTSNTKIELFIDSVLVASKSGLTANGSLANSANLYLGVDGGGNTNYYQGYLDELNIYPAEARTSTTVKADAIVGGGDSGNAATFGDNKTFLSNGLVGYWKFDEASGVRQDLSGNNNTLADTTTVPSTAGKFGYALDSVAAGSEYVSITDANQKNLERLANYSFSFWLKPATGDAVIVGKDSVNGACSFNIRGFSDGGMGMVVCDSFGFYAPVEIYAVTGFTTNSEWQLLTITYDGSYIRLYKNGLEQTVGNFPYFITDATIPDSSSIFSVGGGQYNGSWTYYNGAIDELRIYNRALRSDEVRELYTWAPGPSQWYKLDENAGDTGNDSSGLTSGGTLGASTTKPVWIPGKFGSALSFDGTNDIFNITTLQTLASTDNQTLEAWIKLSRDASGTYSSIYGNSAGPWFQLHRYGSAGSYTYTVNYGTTTEYESAPQTFALNTWYHIAAVRTGTSSLIFYRNGIPIGSFGTHTEQSESNVDTYIGNDNASEPFAGSIDDLRIYNYPRTQSQVIQDMNAGHPAPGSPVGSATLYWDLNEGYLTTAHNLGNGGTINGTLSGGTWTGDGKFGKGVVMSTSASNISAGDQGFIDGLTNMTVSLWIKPTTLATNRYIAQKFATGATSNSFRLATSSGSSSELRFSVASTLSDNESNLFTTTNASLSTGTWYHIVAVYDGTQSASDRVKIYKNGVRLNGTVTGTIPAVMTTGSTSNLGLGDIASNSQALVGTYDEFKIYSSALDVDQVKVEYNQGQSNVFGSVSKDSSGNPMRNDLYKYCVPGDSATCSAPVGEWLFDENKGSTNYDTSGNEHTASFSGSPTPVWNGRCVEGSCLKFTVNDVAEMTSFSDTDDRLDFTTSQDFTLSFWINSSASPENAVPVQKMNNTAEGYGVRLNSSSLVCRYGDGTNEDLATLTYNVNDGNWHQVSCVMDRDGAQIAGTAGLYLILDGTIAASDTTLNTTATGVTYNEAFQIGHYQTNREFEGSIDEVRVYDYARTLPQIAWEMNRGAPIAQYDMDDCASTVLHDTAPKADRNSTKYNGALTIGGSNSYTSPGTCSSGTSTESWNAGTTGKYGSALAINGTGTGDDYAQISTFPTLQNGTGLSVSAWVYRQLNTGNDQHIVSKSTIYTDFGYGNSTFTLYIQGANYYPTFHVASHGAASFNYVTGTTAIPQNTWTLLTGTWDGSTIKLYVNGVLAGQAAQTGYMEDHQTLTIGRNAGASDSFFGGMIDDVRIYNYGLTQTQVQGLLNHNSSVAF